LVGSVFLHRSNHLDHTFFDFADLRMNLFDEVMFDLGELFDPATLFAQLVHQMILFGRDPAHPPKAAPPAHEADYRHPKSGVF
jgi:hypothetical protein